MIFIITKSLISREKTSMSSFEPKNSLEKIPTAQKLFDRPFFWLIAGFAVMLIFYTLWGLFEIWNLPKATLP